MEGGGMTENGEMPKDWKVMKLGDAVEINKASRDPTRENPDEKILYIDIESVEGGIGIIKMTKEILGKEAPSRARRIIHQNDVIMSTVRPYLKAFALVPREYNNQICSTGFAVLSCKAEILPSYLLYSLFSKEVIEQCNKMMMGGQYPALNQSQVAKIKILLPPLPEQRRIAEVLGTVDSAIQKVGGAIESTERLKKGLMQRLLTRGIGHERFKESEVGRMPEEWEVVRLGDAVEINKESRDPMREIPDIKFLYIDIESVEGGIGIIKATKEILGKNAPSRARRVVHQNDVIMSTVRPYLKAFALVPRDYNNQICSTGFAVLSCKNEIIPRYLLYTLFSKNVIEQCNKMMMGGQYPALNQSQVAKIEIPLPPLSEQRRIAEILSTADRKLELERRRKDKLERVKKGLMSELLTGRKRVKIYV